MPKNKTIKKSTKQSTKTSKTLIKNKTPIKTSTKTPIKTPTKTPIKTPIKMLNRSQLSKKIQWLIDLGGTIQLIDAVINNLCGNNKIKIDDSGKSRVDKKEMLVFKKGSGDSGHWVFYDNKGNELNSYDLHHQKSGTNQFCQTFALIYASSYCNKEYKKKFFNHLKEYDFANNIRVAVSFWRQLFTNHFPEFTDWLIEEVKSINEVAIEIDKNDRRHTSDFTITKNTSEINLPFILHLLDDIDMYAEQIALTT